MKKLLLFILIVFEISGVKLSHAEANKPQKKQKLYKTIKLADLAEKKQKAYKTIKPADLAEKKQKAYKTIKLAKSSEKTDNINSFPKNNSYWDNFKFSQVPILHSGRIKPLSSFAREYLFVLSGKSSLPNMSADEWLIETLFDPKNSLNRSLFKIRNPELIDILGLTKNKNSLYSFNELSKALDKIIDQLNAIKNKSEESKSLIEKQLFNLYLKTLSYFELNRSLFMILPIFSVESSKLSEQLGIKANQKYSYLEILKFQPKIDKKIQQFKEINFQTLSKQEQELILLSYRINLLSKNEDNRLFRIIPPQWEDNKELWLSPWIVISKGRGSPLSAEYLETWIQMEKAYRTGKKIKKLWRGCLSKSNRYF